MPRRGSKCRRRGTLSRQRGEKRGKMCLRAASMSLRAASKVERGTLKPLRAASMSLRAASKVERGTLNRERGTLRGTSRQPRVNGFQNAPKRACKSTERGTLDGVEARQHLKSLRARHTPHRARHFAALIQRKRLAQTASERPCNRSALHPTNEATYRGKPLTQGLHAPHTRGAHGSPQKAGRL